MKFIGEHLWVGVTGKIMVCFALVTAIIAFLSFLFYFILSSKNKKTFIQTGKYALLFHFIFIIAAVVILLIALYSGFYEYAYVWSHTASDLSAGYRLSALWAGKEGSLLLWIFLQSLFSVIFLFGYGEKSFKPMMFILPIQIFLVLLVCDFSFLGIHFGESPFLLLRELPANVGSKIFANPDYLSLIGEGRGLNPLLRNFWMLIHPPVIFAGYAASLIPWAIAMSELIFGDDKFSFDISRRFSLIALFFLSMGICFGGAWAYVALSFGGFWVWDPIENASLMPLLIIFAGIHAGLIKKYRSLAQNLFIIAYILVFYAVYLTRSGVLGSLSVHSFSVNRVGQSFGIAVLIITFTYLLLLLIKKFRNKNISENNETQVKTKKFSIAGIGQLVTFTSVVLLVLSTLHIFISTSIPIINFIFGTSLSLPNDTISYYNNWQSVFLIILFLLLILYNIINIYKISKKKSIYMYIFLLIILIFGLTITFNKHISIYSHSIVFITSLLLSACIILTAIITKKIKIDSFLSHLGISFFFMGVVLAFGCKYQFGGETSNNRNHFITLEKGKNVSATEGIMTYTGYEVFKDKSVYNINFKKNNSEKILKFSPSLLHNAVYGDVFEPSVCKVLCGDYFIYVLKSGINPFKDNVIVAEKDSLWISINQTIQYKDLNINLKKIETDFIKSTTDFDNVIINAFLNIQNKNIDTVVKVSYIVKEGNLFHNDAFLISPPLEIKFNSISADGLKIQLVIIPQKSDYIIVKAEYFPFINLLWLGIAMLGSGLLLGIFFQKRCIIMNNNE